jgi:hypothetical protein
MDQFFSPEQFEAYREVGEMITRQMLAQTALGAEFSQERRPRLGRLLAMFERKEWSRAEVSAHSRE